LITLFFFIIAGAVTTGLLSYFSEIQPTAIGMMQQLTM